MSAKSAPTATVLAWSSDVVGDERYRLRFRDLATGTDLPGIVESTFPTGGWSADSTTYLYLRTDAVNRPYQVWAHVLGTDPATDRLVFAEPDDRFEVSLDVTRSGAWFVVTASSRDTSEVHVLSCAEPGGRPTLVRARQDRVEYFVEHAPGPEGDRFLIVTNLDAESFRIVTASVDAPSQWRDYAAEDASARIEEVNAFGSAVVVSARRDGVGMLTVRPYTAAAFEVWPDEPGGLVTLGRNEEFDADFVTVVQQSFIRPARTEDVDIATGRRSLRHTEQIVGVDLDAYVQERHLAPASGGAEVPVVVVRRRDVDLDGTPPLYLYGYGSYEVCMDPDFGYDWPRSLPSLLDRGVVCAFGHPAAAARWAGAGGSTATCGRSRTHLTTRPLSPTSSPMGASTAPASFRAGFRPVVCCRARCTRGGRNASPGSWRRCRSSTSSRRCPTRRCRSPSRSGTSGEILPTPATAT